MTLSICIPSYNRFEKLNQTVKKILKANSDDFEVVIIDNCSPKNIDEYINFDDKRLRIIKREAPVYGAKSMGECILYGKGKYSLVLLDKDCIIGEKLDEFIETLIKHDVCGGYCELNSESDSVEIEEENQVEKFGFLSKHPSGNFYKMEVLRTYMKEKITELQNDTFQLDVYMAFCASKGNMMHYNKPVVCSLLDNIDGEDNVGTLTYKKELGNLYYFPQNRIEQFVVYLKYLSEMVIDKEKKKKILYRLYRRTLVFVSSTFKQIMKNQAICRHYGHESQNVSKLQMIKNIVKLRSVYYKIECDNITKRDKRKIEKLIIISKLKGKKGSI